MHRWIVRDFVVFQVFADSYYIMTEIVSLPNMKCIASAMPKILKNYQNLEIAFLK